MKKYNYPTHSLFSDVRKRELQEIPLKASPEIFPDHSSLPSKPRQLAVPLYLRAYVARYLFFPLQTIPPLFGFQYLASASPGEGSDFPERWLVAGPSRAVPPSRERQRRLRPCRRFRARGRERRSDVLNIGGTRKRRINNTCTNEIIDYSFVQIARKQNVNIHYGYVSDGCVVRIRGSCESDRDDATSRRWAGRAVPATKRWPSVFVPVASEFSH